MFSRKKQNPLVDKLLSKIEDLDYRLNILENPNKFLIGDKVYVKDKNYFRNIHIGITFIKMTVIEFNFINRHVSNWGYKCLYDGNIAFVDESDLYTKKQMKKYLKKNNLKK